jgi:hypothetical protein
MIEARRLRRALLLLVLMAAAAGAGWAAGQDTLPLEGGERVRVTALGVTAEYTVITLRRNELLLRPMVADEVVFLSLPAIDSIALYREWAPGQKSVGWYAGMGALIGGVGGAVAGYARGPQRGCDFFCLNTGGMAAVYGVLFAATGSLTGAVVGVVQPRGYWVNLRRQ